MKLLFLEPPQAKIYQYQFPCVFFVIQCGGAVLCIIYRKKSISALKTQGSEGNRHIKLTKTPKLSLFQFVYKNWHQPCDNR